VLCVERARIFRARWCQAGVTRRKPGEKVGPNEVVAELFSSELQQKYNDARDRFNQQTDRAARITQQLNELPPVEAFISKRLELEQQQTEARGAARIAEAEMKAQI